MNQAIRVEQAQKSRRLIALMIDIVILTIVTAGFYFLFLYAIIGPMYKYNERVETVKQIEVEHGLVLGEDETFDKYEAVVQKFYFEYYPDQIVEFTKKAYPNETYSSITHIYNVFVLNLPYNPTPEGDKYKGDLFQYKLNDDGTVLVDEIGIQRPDLSGYNYERYKQDLFHSKYNKMTNYLFDFDLVYQEAATYKDNIRIASRTCAIGLAVIIFNIVIPLCFKNGQTIGDRSMDVAYVRNKNSLRIKWYQTVVRGISLYILPIIGFAIADKYSIISLMIFPIFVSVLLMLFRQSSRDIPDLVSGTMAVDKVNSLIFRSIGEARVYDKKEENQIVEDKEYLEKLQNTSKMDLTTSRDEEFKNRNKDN